jgi:hypothetical protein
MLANRQSILFHAANGNLFHATELEGRTAFRTPALFVRYPRARATKFAAYLPVFLPAFLPTLLPSPLVEPALISPCESDSRALGTFRTLPAIGIACAMHYATQPAIRDPSPGPCICRKQHRACPHGLCAVHGCDAQGPRNGGVNGAQRTHSLQACSTRKTSR